MELIATLLLLMQGDVPHLSIGEVLHHNLSVCLHREDAERVVITERDKGAAESKKLWDEIDECQSVAVTGGATIGNVVFSAKTERGVIKVVEIKHPNGSVLAYFLTSRDVLPRGRRT